MSIILLGSNSQPLQLRLTAPAVYGAISGAGVCTSGPTSVIVSGGVAPYTYAWTYLNGSSLSSTGVSSVTNSFYASLTFGQSRSSTYYCVVTDSLGQVSNSPYVTVDLYESSYDG